MNETHQSAAGRSTILRGWTWIPTLYFTEGLPYVIVMTVAGIMYKRMGLSNSEIAFYASLLSLPWVIKPIWSPFVDIFSTKRKWILSMQMLMAAGFAAIALTLPGHGWFQASIASFMAISFLSATHDIAADGFYMLSLDEKGQSFFIGIRTTFYRIAMIAGQGPLVVMAGALEISCGDISKAWATVFYTLSATMALIAICHFLSLPHPAADTLRRGGSAKQTWHEFIDTFKDFFRKPQILTATLFMLLYKLPEAQLLKLISPFLLDPETDGGLALTTQEVGLAYGTIGVIGLMAGGIIGGLAVVRKGLKHWIMPMAWSMSLTCLTFVWLAYFPSPSLLMVNICVLIEQFGYGFGTTAYMLYLIHFAKGQRSTSYYAIATGIMSLGMMLPGMAAGWLEELIGYGPFFIWTMVCCTATIVVSIAVRRKL